MISVMPTYQQHYSIPESIGAEVRIHQLTLENKFLPDLDLLRSQVDENTRMITINNPDNPTGSWIPKEEMMEIVKIAQEVGAFILSDEVYRGISEDGSYMHFFYGPIQEGVAQVVNDSDIARKEPVDIHGVPGEFYLAADPAVSNTLIWSDEDIGMSFTISGFLEKEDMLHMAESVFSSDPTNQKN